MQLVRSERYDQKIETSISEPRAMQEIIPPTPIAKQRLFRVSISTKMETNYRK